SATSGPRILRPARTPAKRKPGTRTPCARLSSLIARGARTSRRGPVALLVLLPAAGRPGVAAAHLLGVAADRLHLLRPRGRRPTVRETDALRRRLPLATLHVGHRPRHLRLRGEEAPQPPAPQ